MSFETITAEATEEETTEGTDETEEAEGGNEEEETTTEDNTADYDGETAARGRLVGSVCDIELDNSGCVEGARCGVREYHDLPEVELTEE